MNIIKSKGGGPTPKNSNPTPTFFRLEFLRFGVFWSFLEFFIMQLLDANIKPLQSFVHFLMQPYHLLKCINYSKSSIDYGINQLFFLSNISCSQLSTNMNDFLNQNCNEIDNFVSNNVHKLLASSVALIIIIYYY